MVTAKELEEKGFIKKVNPDGTTTYDSPKEKFRSSVDRKRDDRTKFDTYSKESYTFRNGDLLSKESRSIQTVSSGRVEVQDDFVKERLSYKDGRLARIERFKAEPVSASGREEITKTEDTNLLTGVSRTKDVKTFIPTRTTTTTSEKERVSPKVLSTTVRRDPVTGKKTIVRSLAEPTFSNVRQDFASTGKAAVSTGVSSSFFIPTPPKPTTKKETTTSITESKKDLSEFDRLFVPKSTELGVVVRSDTVPFKQKPFLEQLRLASSQQFETGKRQFSRGVAEEKKSGFTTPSKDVIIGAGKTALGFSGLFIAEAGKRFPKKVEFKEDEGLIGGITFTSRPFVVPAPFVPTSPEQVRQKVTERKQFESAVQIGAFLSTPISTFTLSQRTKLIQFNKDVAEFRKKYPTPTGEPFRRRPELDIFGRPTGASIQPKSELRGLVASKERQLTLAPGGDPDFVPTPIRKPSEFVALRPNVQGRFPETSILARQTQVAAKLEVQKTAASFSKTPTTQLKFRFTPEKIIEVTSKDGAKQLTLYAKPPETKVVTKTKTSFLGKKGELVVGGGEKRIFTRSVSETNIFDRFKGKRIKPAPSTFVEPIKRKISTGIVPFSSSKPNNVSKIIVERKELVSSKPLTSERLSFQTRTIPKEEAVIIETQIISPGISSKQSVSQSLSFESFPITEVVPQKVTPSTHSTPITTFTPSTPISSTTPRTRPPRFSVPPIIPPVRFDKPTKKTFGVEVRREGKFVSVGQGLSLRQAVSLGKRKVKTTAAATFRITGGTPTRDVRVGGEFRTSTKQPFTFIQKRRFRISSSGELRDITFKGLAAQKSKKRKKKGEKLLFSFA